MPNKGTERFRPRNREGEKAMAVRFLQNGIKADGKYIPVFYGMCNDMRTITVYARHYDRLPSEIGDIANDSDSVTDYFETDHCRIAPGNPYYFAAYAAYRQKWLSDLKRRLAATEKRMVGYPAQSDYRKSCEIEIESIKAEMARLAQ